jgi:putative exosortase-associated protein (TIGR04073 family)
MKQKKTMVIGIALAAVLFVAFTFSAGAYDPMRKLARGIVNIGLGGLEVPMKVYDVNEEEGGVAAFTYGIIKGLGYAVAREVIGVVEVATFIIPLPGAADEPREIGWGTGCLMEPEWVVDKRHDIYNIIFQDLPVD